MDITERKKAEEKTRASEKQLRLVTDAIPALISYVDAEQRYQFVNQAYTDWFGHAPEEIVGKPVREVLGEAAYAEVLPALERVFSGEACSFERLLPYKDGGARFVSVNYVPDQDEKSGKVKGYYALVQDITERKRAEEISQRYQMLSVRARDVILFVRPDDGQIVDANQKAVEMYGYDLPTLLQMKIHDLRAPETLPKLAAQIEQAKEGGVQFETVHRRRDGTTFPVEVSSIGSNIGGERLLTSIIRDITERKEAEEKLRRTQARLESALAAGLAGTFYWDVIKDRVVTDENMSRYFSLSERALTEGVPLAEALPAIFEADRPLVEKALTDAIESTDVYSVEYRVKQSDGNTRWLSARGTVERDESGVAIGLPGFAVDITRIKEVEEDQKLLLDIGEKIRRAENTEELLFAVVQAVGQHLQVTRCLFTEIDLERDTAMIYRDFYAAGSRSLEGKIPPSQFSPDSINILRSGRTLINDDIKNNPRTAEFYEGGYKSLGMEAFVGVPLLRDGRWTAALAVVADQPRHWNEREIGLLETVAERAWLAVEKLRSEAALHESEERFSKAFNTSPHLMTVTTLDGGHYLTVNDAVLRTTGYTRGEMIGQTADELRIFVEPEGGAKLLGAFRDGIVRDLEIRLRTKDGETRLLNLSADLITVQGQRCVLTSSVDITERKRAEENEKFLLEIAEKIRYAENAPALLFAVAQAVGQYLGVARCAFDEVYLETGTAKVHRDYYAAGLQPGARSFSMAEFSRSTLGDIKAGRTVAVSDSSTDERTAALYETKYQPHGFAAYVAVPLLRDGRWTATLRANHEEPHAWSQPEVALLETVAERTWLAVEKLRSEAALRESEERFAKAFNSSPLVITITSLNTGKLIEVNETFTNQTGYSREEAIGRTTNELGLWERPPDRDTELATVKRDGQIRNREYRFRMKDGAEIIGLLSAELLEIGGEPCVLTVIQDITERKQAEERLRVSEEKFRNLANSISQFAWMADASGFIFWYNERWFEYTGTTLEEMRGWGWQAIHHPEEVERVTEKFKQHIATGEPWEDTFPLRSKTGEYRWFLSRARPIHDEQGRIVRWFGTNTDVEELRQARKAAEEANRLKDEFLATVSHELRTPLNAILGWSAMARSGGPDMTNRALEIIERNARAQNQIISDILDVSRIITGKLNFEPTTVDLIPVTEAAIESVRPALEAKRIRLTTAYAPGDNLVIGDANRLQQIVWNLLSNAAKFTPEGGQIEVKLERADDHHVEIIVSDKGEGIAPEFLPFVFDRFRQADGATTRQHGGLGLGLAIVRHLTELHGGSVRVESAGSGQGATFTVRLPRLPLRIGTSGLRIETVASDQLAIRNPSSAILQGTRVLVVDDEEDALSLVSLILSAHGAEVVTAQSTAEALAKLNDASPQILVSDIGMPEMDGYDLLREVRERLPQGAHLPALALTAYARDEDRQRALAAGYQAHLPKPVEPPTLIKIVAALANNDTT